MNGTIQFKRKSALHWDSITFDGLFLTLRELQRAIALKKFPDSLEQAEQAIEVLEGDVKLTDPLKQIPHGSKVAIRFVRVEDRRDFQNRRPAGAVPAAPGQSQGPVLGAELFGQQEDDLDAIRQRMAADEAAPALPAGRGQGRRGRGGIGGSFGRGFSSRPATCRICGLPDHDAADCPNKDAERKTRVTGIPTANLVPDEKGTLLINGSIPARILPDEQAFQQYVGGSSSAQPPSLPQPPTSTAPATALEAPPAEPPLALTQFAHADVPSLPAPASAPALPQLAGEDMVFEDAAFEDSLPPAAAPKSPLQTRSPQQDASESQFARLASLELRSKEADMQRLLRKQNAMLEPLSMDEFKTLQRLSFEVEKGKQLREQRHLQREREQQARSKPSPPVARRPQRRASVSPARGRPRPSRDRSPIRSRRRTHRSRSRGHRRARSPSSSGYSSDQHARRDSRRRGSYRSRRHRSMSPSRSPSPSYHSRERASRQASHKRPRTARAPVPTRTGLSSPSQSRDPSRDATPALAASPHKSPFEDSSPPARATTPQLAGIEDQDEPVVLDDAANKRPRVNRWASGAATTRMPVPSQLSKASVQQQQQQLQTGKASVVGRVSDTVKAAAIEAEEPRKIRPVASKAAASVSQPPGKLEGIKYKVPLDGLAHPEMSLAAPEQPRASKRKSKQKTSGRAPPPSDPSQPHKPSSSVPPANSAQPALHDPLDEPPSSNWPDVRQLKRKTHHADPAQDLDAASRSPVDSAAAVLVPQTDAAEPSLLEDSVEDLMPLRVIPSAAAGTARAIKPPKEKHSKHKASKEKSFKSSKSGRSRAGKDILDRKEHGQDKKDTPTNASAPAGPDPKVKEAQADRDAEGSSYHRSSKQRSGKEQAVPAGAAGTQPADQPSDVPPRSLAHAQSRSPGRHRAGHKLDRDADPPAGSRSPSRHRADRRADMHAEQEVNRGGQADSSILRAPAQEPSQRSHSSRHRSQSRRIDASGPAGEAGAAVLKRLQPAVPMLDAEPASGPAAAASYEAAAAKVGCSKPAEARGQAQPDLHAAGAPHKPVTELVAAVVGEGNGKKEKKHKKDKVKKEKKAKRHKDKLHKKHKHDAKSESEEEDIAAPSPTSKADVEAVASHQAVTDARHQTHAPLDNHAHEPQEEANGRLAERQSRSSAFSRLGEKGREHQRHTSSRHRESSRSHGSDQRALHQDRAINHGERKSLRPEAVTGVDPSDRWQSDQ